MLEDKKLLITGVITRDSIAWEVARQAQEAGAEVVLTGFGRAKRLTDRAAKQLPDAARRARARRQQARGPRGGRRRARRALGPRRRRAARDRLRARGRARRQLPHDAGRERDHRVPDERVLVQGARRRARRPLPRGGRERRRDGLRRLGRLAGLRLDGRRQGRARGDLALPRARPRPARRAREPRQRRPARHDRRARHPRASPSSPTPGRSRRRSAGRPTTPAPSPARSASCCPTSRAAITAEILHVDGGFHAMGTPLEGMDGTAERPLEEAAAS